jgi:hypothetical protein
LEYVEKKGEVDAGCGMQDTGYMIRDARYWMLDWDAGYEIQDTRYGILEVR